jgi:hypothetical protein
VVLLGRAGRGRGVEIEDGSYRRVLPVEEKKQRGDKGCCGGFGWASWSRVGPVELPRFFFLL